jgi:hypothetical protein
MMKKNAVRIRGKIRKKKERGGRGVFPKYFL